MVKEFIERKRAIVDACNSLELYPSEYATLEDALNRIPAADVVPAAHGELTEHIRGLLRAEKDGRLVVLPCKVGDTIYRCGDPIKKIYEWQIAYVEVYEDETVFVDDSDNTFVEADIGKTVFLTREEAEKALEGNR